MPGLSEEFLQKLEKAHGLRDAGIEAVTANTPEEWKAAFDKAIVKLAASGRPFTADDVFDIIGDPPNHPNAWGAMFSGAARQGLIRMTGTRRPSVRLSTHGRYLQVWIGA